MESTPAREALLGVDVGGTFTDAVLVKRGHVFTAKVPTTPADQSEGVMAAVALVLERAGSSSREVRRFAHGMTVGTNALLEERGARVGLLTTEGFTDVLELARQARPELYRLCHGRPRPLVPAALRVGVRERTGPDGVIVPLDEGSLARALDRLEAAKVESVAVSLLHSYRDPTHEQRVASALAERLPDIHVSASHDVLSLFREYERTSTTVVDAYLSPLLSRYLERLAASAAEANLPEAEIMQSSGGLMPAAEAAHRAAWTVLSGPAGGAVGAAYLGKLSGHPDVLSFDMGGTSCDVGVVDGGRVRQTAEREIGGRALQLPMVDVHTVGTGGGSIGWADPGGALRVGPRSAGAQPGPACYGAGGEDATVTDANVALGFLDPEAVLPGGIALDADAAERALSALGERLGLDAAEAAAGILRVADQDMMRALRVITVERGIDPRRYTLVAFGGAGPMHAARIAEQLGVERVLCPRASGVLSALGLVVSDRRRDFARSLLLSGSQLTAERIAAAVAELSETALAQFSGAQIEVSYDLRYQGQAFELTVEESARPDPARLRARFERAHEERYGYSDGDAQLELVNLRVAALAGGARPELTSAGEASVVRGSRLVLFGAERLQTAVVTGEPAAGEVLEGPAVCELPEATVVIPPGWRGEVGRDGTLVLELEGGP
jgi:N-methylhydantoinase A